MKGYRFYEELYDKGRKSEEPRGTVVAVMLDEDNRPIVYYPTRGGVNYSAVVGVYDEPDSDVCTSGVDIEYVQYNCRRVSEKRARKIHPELFKYLDR